MLGIERQRGSQLRANTSITIMRAPQRGHGQGSTRRVQPGGEPLAARNVAALSVRVELACSHVLDHALTQRTDSFNLTIKISICSGTH